MGTVSLSIDSHRKCGLTGGVCVAISNQRMAVGTIRRLGIYLVEMVFQFSNTKLGNGGREGDPVAAIFN